MLLIRSLIFNFAFYLLTAIFVIIGIPLLLAPRHMVMLGMKLHSLSCLWLLKVIAGTKLEVRGRENLPAGAALIAAKHQSAWDTFALPALLADPAMVMKRELFWIPVYGWFSRKMRMIPVNRSAGGVALRKMLRHAQARAEAGRQIVIFPEGSRKSLNAPPDYKSGIFKLYNDLDIPCIPLALNSGLYWPRRQFLRYPGTITVKFLPEIESGLEREEFMMRLQDEIETATCELREEARPATR
jgi:1-acyl-sn-glycerol-3-phosphate acyltransferase